MGIKSNSNSGIAGALFSGVQQRVLGLLFGQPDRRFQGSEIIRLAESGTGAVHRQLKTLAGSGLVTVTAVGNQKYYQANHDSPVFTELHGLIIKTVGLAEPLREALAPFANQITVAFVYGSIAKGTDTAQSDIDLMLIGEHMAYADIYKHLENAEKILHRSINPNLLTREEWNKRLTQKNHFILSVQSQPKLFIIGSKDDLETTRKPG
ncbi:MAG: nucleotidyltransferase domain-containing protein [Gammaproteobacteria bacterium]|nr:nucleotidyltransferase domain-containing protein [Gammaproteobacteria bacterium]